MSLQGWPSTNPAFETTTAMHNDSATPIVAAAQNSKIQASSSNNLGYLLTDQSVGGTGADGATVPFELTTTPLGRPMNKVLIEYSFAFGDVHSFSTGLAHNYPRVGVNLHVMDGGAEVLKQAIGNVTAAGGLIGDSPEISGMGWGSGAGAGNSYYPVFMRYLHVGGLSAEAKIKLTISATDVIQCRLRDIVLTAKEIK